MVVSVFVVKILIVRDFLVELLDLFIIKILFFILEIMFIKSLKIWCHFV